MYQFNFSNVPCDELRYVIITSCVENGMANASSLKLTGCEIAMLESLIELLIKTSGERDKCSEDCNHEL